VAHGEHERPQRLREGLLGLVFRGRCGVRGRHGVRNDVDAVRSLGEQRRELRTDDLGDGVKARDPDRGVAQPSERELSPQPAHGDVAEVVDDRDRGHRDARRRPGLEHDDVRARAANRGRERVRPENAPEDSAAGRDERERHVMPARLDRGNEALEPGLRARRPVVDARNVEQDPGHEVLPSNAR
jgi:hypothetical protein